MRFAMLAAALLLAAPPSTAPAALQQTQSGAAAGRIEPRIVVEQVRRVIAERYVLPERRPALDSILARGLASGRYDVSEPGALAERINADLETAGRDRHLSFAYHPEHAAMLAAPAAGRTFDDAAFARQARAANHGVAELRVLPGNIRYLAYEGFIWVDGESAAALANAMRFLAGGDAVIIDIRRNGGGSPQAVQYLVSHFLPADRPLVTFHMGGEPEPDRLSSLAELPAGRMIGKPLYVLTSGGTASAAEEFSGHVGGYRLGELVGETTAGAGFRNEMVAIEGGFVLSVSVGRAVLASTGRDWEAVGIAPTIRSEADQALDVAHVHALRRLAAAASPEERPRLVAIAESVEARIAPRSPALALAAYAGEYGERAVSLEEGRLYYRRGNRPKTALVPLGGHRFAFATDPAVVVDFAVEGSAAAALDIVEAGGASQGRYDRTR
ncbi:MAG TPA: S41 family peptidase [Allosphingosinicella sp.]|nr:S41 family peptidase [Allosphingosinicella sp.]